MTWPDVVSRPVVLVPVGSTEQHGPHLPFDADTAIAVSVAHAVASKLGSHVVVAPAINYGASGEHQAFPGTASIGADVLRLVVVELVRSLSTWAGQVVLINAHGGNVSALSKAVLQLVAEQHNIAWVPCTSEGADLHAGVTETALMLHIRPQSVRLDRARPGETRPIADILPALIAGGVASVSATGVLGDPRGATAAEGRRLLELMSADCRKRIEDGVLNERGMLVRR
ncbi:mycofactocin biosynthesis peptidyl-dipeptidase MftE [Pseudarthrobacter oxydans]|uniref:mycofactocin biosynthesis peptidyl-dipeptidase MftE n=1 Tax=Pseudarthrobacter oxydans TaxID=1671 RepID=UPI00344FFFDC